MNENKKDETAPTERTCSHVGVERIVMPFCDDLKKSASAVFLATEEDVAHYLSDQINKARGMILSLTELCENNFTDGMIQPYAGAVRECRFCEATQPRDGSFPDHSVADCPVMKYKMFLEA